MPGASAWSGSTPYADELERLLRGLCAIENVRTLTVCEINPEHEPDDAALQRMVQIVASACAR